MNTFGDFLSHTPAYAFFIFFYLLFAGIKASKDRVVSIYKTAFIAVAFFLLSIGGVTKLKLHPSLILAYLSIIILSGLVGWFRVSRAKIFVDKEKKLISLPGSWITLGLLLAIFSSKYYLGYNLYRDPTFFQTTEAKLITILASGFSFGFVFGRLLNYLYRFKSNPHTKLGEGNEESS